MNGVPPDLHKYFGAYYGSDDNSEAEDLSSLATSTDGSQDTMGSKEGEEYSLCESESEFSYSFDSPDIASLSLSPPEAGQENMQTPSKKNHDKQKTPQKNVKVAIANSIRLNVALSDLDFNIYTPKIFIHDG
jgi:hypothetical protein